MMNRKINVFVVICCVLLISCGDDEGDTTVPLEVIAINPTSGGFDSNVQIAGRGFEGSDLKVTINGKDAPISSALPTLLIVTVPKGAGSGKFVVSNSTGSIESQEFTYILSPFVSTFAGQTQGGFADGKANEARFNSPQGIAVDASNNLFVMDLGNNRIRKIDVDGNVSTFVGNGNASSNDGSITSATINRPYGCALSSDGTLFVTETETHRIRSISPSGQVSTLGQGSSGYVNGNENSAKFSSPYGLVAIEEDIYIADRGNNVIRKISIPLADVSTLSGNTLQLNADGTGNDASFAFPGGLAFDGSGLIVLCTGAIRKVSLAGTASTLSYSGGFIDAPGPNTFPAVSSEGDLIFIASNRIERITKDGKRSVIAGAEAGYADGKGTEARFNNPAGIAISKSGDIFLTDGTNNLIRRITFE